MSIGGVVSAALSDSGSFSSGLGVSRLGAGMGGRVSTDEKTNVGAEESPGEVFGAAVTLLPQSDAVFGNGWALPPGGGGGAATGSSSPVTSRSSESSSSNQSRSLSPKKSATRSVSFFFPTVSSWPESGLSPIAPVVSHHKRGQCHGENRPRQVILNGPSPSASRSVAVTVVRLIPLVIVFVDRGPLAHLSPFYWAFPEVLTRKLPFCW